MPLKKFNYIDRDGLCIKRVYCKVCGGVIVDSVVIEEKQEKRGDKDFIIQKTALKPLTSYDEIIIKFADGSAHMTPICKNCKQTEDLDLKEIYKADMVESLKEGYSLPFREIKSRSK